MSYDVWLTIPTGGDEEPSVEDVGNYTSNVSGMWRLALGYSLGDLHGRTAADCIHDLERAVAEISNPVHAATYVAMEPSNKWGSHAGATRYLTALLDACKRHPATRIRISR